MRLYVLTALVGFLFTAGSTLGSPMTFLREHTPEDPVEQAVIEENEIDQDIALVPPVIVTQSRSNGKSKSRFQGGNREWVQMPKSPPGALNIPARARVELECEAIGSPAPQIYWLHGGEPLRQLEELVGNSVADMEGSSNTWGGVARTRSKLVIECASPRDRGLIHCAAMSGSRTALSNPTMLLVNELEKGNGSSCGAESRPRITLHSPIMMAPIGSTVVLPCRASGRPRPRTFWLDNNERAIVSSTNPRYKVLGSGELVIYPLEWNDMGGFTCVARTDREEDASTTFLYPILNDDNQS
ncbi:neural/ectodermal development factor IMP-L2 [Cephus cinctus]|uniref:Neural/ectodermal development factor IMP-L2 n=1 Tax=Cephus cinctus TaxID=211228 RepID=A0AAJ7BR05_CEPCN|nr:neural/ectodermal development factor IMP-L2 [Cephus cinctus]